MCYQISVAALLKLNVKQASTRGNFIGMPKQKANFGHYREPTTIGCNPLPIQSQTNL